MAEPYDSAAARARAYQDGVDPTAPINNPYPRSDGNRILGDSYATANGRYADTKSRLTPNVDYDSYVRSWNPTADQQNPYRGIMQDAYTLGQAEQSAFYNRQSGLDEQAHLRDLEYAQAGADLSLRNTQTLMGSEYAYGIGGMREANVLNKDLEVAKGGVEKDVYAAKTQADTAAYGLKTLSDIQRDAAQSSQQRETLGKQGAEQRLGIETQSGADIRRDTAQAEQQRQNIGVQGFQQRLNIGAQGAVDIQRDTAQAEQQRLNLGVQGYEQRLNIGAQGAADIQRDTAQAEQQRQNIGVQGYQQRLNIGAQGAADIQRDTAQAEQQRATIGVQGEQQRQNIQAQGNVDYSRTALQEGSATQRQAIQSGAAERTGTYQADQDRIARERAATEATEQARITGGSSVEVAREQGRTAIGGEQVRQRGETERTRLTTSSSERQIGLTGEQQRLGQREAGSQERQGKAVEALSQTGGRFRDQAGTEYDFGSGTIGRTGEESRKTIETQGEQQRRSYRDAAETDTREQERRSAAQRARSFATARSY